MLVIFFIAWSPIPFLPITWPLTLFNARVVKNREWKRYFLGSGLQDFGRNTVMAGSFRSQETPARFSFASDLLPGNQTLHNPSTSPLLTAHLDDHTHSIPTHQTLLRGKTWRFQGFFMVRKNSISAIVVAAIAGKWFPYYRYDGCDRGTFLFCQRSQRL